MYQYPLPCYLTSIMQTCALIAILLVAMVSAKKENNCTMDTGLKCNYNEPLEPWKFYSIKSRCKNGKYLKNEKCSWRFSFTECSPIINCDYIDLRKGKGKSCRRGDKLRMSTSTGWKKTFCGKNSNFMTILPEPNNEVGDTQENYLDIKFTSNKKRKGKRKGFQCQVTCETPISGPPEPTTEGSGDTEDTTTVAQTTTTTASSECRCGEANRALRIVGGVATEKNEYPWQVLVYATDMPDGFCGGSILSSRTILTAAHCFTRAPVKDHTVVVAEHDWTVTGDGEQRMKVCDRVDHPNYNDDTVNYDFAILTLCEDIAFNKTASPVCLPSQPESDYANVPAIVSGWGHHVSGGFNQLEQLMEVDVNTITNTKCRAAYGPSEITDSMICASNPGKDSCQNDSGGPLITDEGGYYSQIGVVSWGAGCADPDYPGVYARVTSAESFIQDNMSGTTCPPPQ